MKIWKWTVSSEQASERLDRAISKAIEQGLGEWAGEAPAGILSASRSQIQKWIEDGRVRVNDVVARASLKTEAGMNVQVEVPAPKSMELIPEARDLDVLFEDEHLIVLNKPPGLTVHPSETQTEGTLVHALLHHAKDLSGIGGVLRPGIVHRIDKDTSGALVITKSDQAHQKLAEIFAKHEIDRVYWALCYGVPKEEQGTIEGLLGRNPTDRKKMSANVKTGRKAVTHYRVLERYAERAKNPFASHFEITLETGRTHQIRVHLTGLGTSVLGDPVYGSPTERQTKWQALPKEIQAAVTSLPGQALHARTLGFIHPVTGKKLHFEAPPPENFSKLLQALKKYA